jgi:hypothetical protein
LTGHDFLSIGTGNTVTSNYPSVNNALTVQANETLAINPGRVYYTSTDQDGNFRVGELFTIEQSTGVATLNANGIFATTNNAYTGAKFRIISDKDKKIYKKIQWDFRHKEGCKYISFEET